MKISTDVKKQPVSSTVNDWASGSPLLTLIVWNTFVILIIWGIGGGGNSLIPIVVWDNVSTTPDVRYVVWTLLTVGELGTALTFVGLVVNLNDLVPFVKRNGGTGVVKGLRIKNVPLTLPTLSVINLTLGIVAIAPLVSPTSTVCVSILPKNLPCASSANDAVSMFKTVEDAEYVLGMVTVGSYGLVVYVNVGAEKGPLLWLGCAILKNPTKSAPVSPVLFDWTTATTLSPIWKDPETISISTNFGIISIPLVLSKNG